MRFWSAFDGARLDAVRSITYAMVRNRVQDRVMPIGGIRQIGSVVAPKRIDRLQRTLEAEVTGFQIVFIG